jgi:hypothetical protein
MLQIEIGVLLHAGILSFDHFEICEGRIIYTLQRFKYLIVVVRCFVNRYPGA